MRKLICLLFALFLVGCASVTQSFIPLEHKKSTSFLLGKITEANIGDAMVTEEDLYFFEGLMTATAFQPPAQLGVSYPVIPKGAIFKEYGKLQNGDILFKETIKHVTADKFWEYCIAQNSAGQFYGDAACAVGLVRKWPNPSNEFQKTMIYQTGTFRMELIYNGKSQNTIKLSYREFREDLARPAFFQDLSYDLSESKTVGFRRMKLDIIEATNSSIKFIVNSSMQ